MNMYYFLFWVIFSVLFFFFRLKGRERDVLTGVFSKYSSNSGATPTEKS